MRKVCFAFLLVLSATASYAQNSSRVVKWESIVGVMTAPNVDNPVAGISSGTLPWWTKGGRARVDLFTGAVSFNVQGLVLIGASPTGTAGPVTDVTGTLVCNPNDPAPIVIDSPPAKLTPQGDAQFSGQLKSNVPPACANPVFLIRIGPGLPGAMGRWIATGVSPVTTETNGAQ